MNKAQALNTFWNGFNIPAYDTSTVPDDAVMPYITYEVNTGSFGDQLSILANLWYRTSKWSDITQKADEIAEEITMGGKLVEYNGGALWIRRASPFAQRMTDPDDEVRRIVLLTMVEYISAD